MPEEMDLLKAYKLFEMLGGQFHGTLKDHQNIQAALIVIKRELFGLEDMEHKVELENGMKMSIAGKG